MPDNLDVEESLKKQSSEDKGQDKVDLDLDALEDTETPQVQPKGEKVELDLDDAPFLQEEEKEQQEEPKKEKIKEEPKEEVEPEKPKVFWKNKWLWIISIVLILGLGGGSYFFLSKEESPPPPPPKQAQPKKEEKKQEPPPPEEQIVNFDKFIIELQDKNKEAFLEIKLALATTNGKLAWEIKRKKIVLRDAIYYYLSNKDLAFLSNTKKLEEIKKDLLNVVNQYLNNGQLEKILIENYIIS